MALPGRSKRHSQRTLKAALYGCAALLAALALAPAARAAGVSDEEELTRFGGEGAAAGRLDLPEGIATDPIDGHVYVVGNGRNNRIDEFTPWGGFVKAFGWDVAPGAVNEQQEVRVRAATGAFRLELEGHPSASVPLGATAPELESALDALPGLGAGAVHVEAVPGSADGKSPYVYAIAFRGSRAATNVPQLATVNEGLTGGQPSTLLEASTRAEGHAATAGLESCTEESGCQAGLEGGGAGELKDARAVAIDPAGDVFVREVGNDRVQKFDSAGRFLLTFGGKVDKTKVEAAAPEAQQNRCTAASGDVCQAGAPGAGQGQFSNGAGISSGISLGPPGEIFVGDDERFQRFDLEGEYEAQAPLPGKSVEGLAFDPVSGDLYATFNSEGGVHKLDPATGAQLGQLAGQNGVATDAAGDVFAEEANAANRHSVFEYGPGGSPLSPASCCESPLFPNPGGGFGQFNPRAIATNAIGDLYVAYYVSSVDSFIRSFGPGPVSFETQPSVAPTIAAQFATSVQTDGATVGAEINPHFWPDTRYYLQYGTAKCSEGGCEEEKPLPPGTLLTAKQTGLPQKATVSLEGLAPGTVYHYRFLAKSGGGGPAVGEEATFTTYEPLPAAACPNDVFRIGPGARLPDCRAYEMVSPLDKNNGDVLALGFTELEQSSADGQKLTYSSYRSFADPKGAAYTNQYLARRDPSAGWQSESIVPSLATPSEELNFTAGLTNPFKAFSGDLCESWYVAATEPLLDPAHAFAGYPNAYRRDLCSGEADEALIPVEPSIPAREFDPEPQGASADGKEAIVRAKLQAGGPWRALYASGGEARPLCIQPDGTPSVGNCSGGTSADTTVELLALGRLANVAGAISDDGARAYWTDSGEKANGAGKVYLRLDPGDPESAAKDGKGNCLPEAERACTVAVSGAKTPKASRFLAASPDGSKALFEVMEGPLAGNLYLFALGAGSVKLAGKTLGVAGQSEDLSRIYFVSEEVLPATSGATEGRPNLYLDNEGAFAFVATLSGTDAMPAEFPGDTMAQPLYQAARATPDGGALAFISTASLGGYDNTDQESGAADSEAYLYRAGTGGPVCVSCNPGGARPRGRVVGGVLGTAHLATAASIPMASTELHVPRALSSNGARLFFDSYDALAPRDTNGKEDVYEWEAASGRAECEEKGAELYVAASGGCLSLISSGESPQDSEFADAGADGHDVFFTTNASLLPQDPGLIDLYDAREGGGFPQSVAPAACEGEACQSPPKRPATRPPPRRASRAPATWSKKRRARRAARRARCAAGAAVRASRAGRPRRSTPSTGAGLHDEAAGDAPRRGRPRRAPRRPRRRGRIRPRGLQLGLLRQERRRGDPGRLPPLRRDDLLRGQHQGRPGAGQGPRRGGEDGALSAAGGLHRLAHRGADLHHRRVPDDRRRLPPRLPRRDRGRVHPGRGGKARHRLRRGRLQPRRAAGSGGEDRLRRQRRHPGNGRSRPQPIPPYNLSAAAVNILQAANFYSAELQLWGIPAAHSHDPYRGSCLNLESGPAGEPLSLGTCDTGAPEVPFLTLPRSCHGPLITSFEAISWQQPDAEPDTGLAEAAGMSGCSALGFNPQITAKPTTLAAQSPSGLDFSLDLQNEGLTNPAGLSNADLEKAVVTLPEGITANPSLAEGLGVCSEQELARETPSSAPGAGCPEASKIGTVEVQSPLIEEPLAGTLYVAKPYENPFDSLLALYMVIKSANLGIVVRQPLKVEPDPTTGQLIATAEEVPQLPFSELRLHLREGGRSPLISPPRCGSFDATATLYPSSGGAPASATSAFQIASGPNEGPCPPGGVAPFHPSFEAGSLNNSAGAYSPFEMRLTRKDGEQDMTRFSAVLPPGVLGKLAGLAKCPDSAIAQAKARTGPHGGREELERPSCPASSKIGRVLGGAGVGSQLTYVPGSLYLAGPIGGDPLSVVAIVPALAGPFDAGTVVVREALTLNPLTAEVEVDGAHSDPIPHILKGIPLNVRDLRVYADRPNFTLNPTDCEPSSARATLFGSFLKPLDPSDDVPIGLSARYQAADCAALGFKPEVRIALKGGTKRGKFPALSATVTPRAGDANFKSAVVTLPHSAFLEQGHFKTICTRVQFAAGGGNGEQCPAASIYGTARATSPLLEEPFSGPVFLRSSNHNLPDLVVALHGLVNIDLASRIDSHKGGIRSTFEAIPDAPVSRFVLEMQGGAKGLIVNSTDLCSSVNRAKGTLSAQSGKLERIEPVVAPRCPKAKKHKGKGKRKAARR